MQHLEKLLQNKKLLAVVVGAVALVLIIFVYVTTQDKPPVTDTMPEASASSTDTSVVFEPLESSEAPDAPDNGTASEIPDDGTGLKPDESITTGSGKTNSREKAQEPAPPAKEADPPKKTENNNVGGIVIGGGKTESEYDCGCANHHCANADVHAYILNLEKEGCPYCGSHSCPSFYAVDEWGNTCYTPSQCPRYDITKDPVYYCQVCGRKNGNGDNDTCQKWIVDFTCPICGKLVKANECHTH